MKKLFISLGAVIVLVVVLLIALVIALPKLVDTQTFKTQLTEQVRQLTGQELSVNGDLSISVFPWLGIRTGAIRLSQPPKVGLDQPPFLVIERADLGIKLLPLLQKKIEISDIIFISPKIHYIETPNGISSLDSFTTKEAPTQNKAVTQAQDSPKASFHPATVMIAGINITEGELTIDNQATRERHRIQNLRLSVGNLLAGNQEPLKFSTDITLHQQTTVSVIVEADAQLDFGSQELTINALSLSAQQEAITLDASLDQLRANPEQIALNGLMVSINTANLLETVLTPSLSIRRLTFDLVNQKTQNIAFSLLENTLGINATGDIQIRLNNGSPQYNGQLAIDELSPKKIIETFGIDYQTTNDEAFHRLTMATQFEGGDQTLSFNDWVIALDQSKVNGHITINDFSKPRYNFALKLDRINLDDYLPPTKEPATNQTQANPSKANALILPIEIFKDIYANGNFTAELIQASGVKLEALNLAIDSTESTVNIKPTASLYGGSIEGFINYESLSAERSQLSIAPKFTNVEFGGLLNDADITDQITGQGSLDIDVTVTDDDGIQTNQGTIGFFINDGTLKNIDIQQSLYDAQAHIDRLKGKTPRQRPTTQNETRFAEASGTFAVDNFLLRNKDLIVKAPAFRINGQGVLNIAEQTLDYLANIAIVETSEGQGGRALADLKGLIIPLKIDGAFTQPNPSVNVKQLLAANTKRNFNQQKNDTKQAVGNKIEEKKRTLLEEANKGLLKQLFK